MFATLCRTERADDEYQTHWAKAEKAREARSEGRGNIERALSESATYRLLASDPSGLRTDVLQSWTKDNGVTML